MTNPSRPIAPDPTAFYLQAIGCDPATVHATTRGDRNAPSPSQHHADSVSGTAINPSPPAQTGNEEQNACSWSDLKQQVAECTACDLAQGRKQTVFGSGNPNAELLLIGEAPGRDEDIQGEPFVGRAGRLLNRMLAAIGLSRQQVQIINVVKCRPPQNRDPRPQEIAACRHFIDAQIDMVQPKIILLLGRVAACSMLRQDAPLSVLRHRWHQVHEVPAFVTYHPAYLLRSPQQKVESWRDFLEVRARLRNAVTDTREASRA